MPIRPENKDRYPDDWKEISLRIREEAGQLCEWCQKPNRELVTVASGGRWYDATCYMWRGSDGDLLSENPKLHETRDIKVVLTVAHLNHTPEDNRRENLKALCQACHLAYDAPHKAAERRRRKEESNG